MDNDDAWRAHVMRTAKNLNPEDFKPWTTVRPGGCTLLQAITELVRPEWRNSVSNFLARVHAGIEPASGLNAEIDKYWFHVLWRLQRGELTMKAKRLGETVVQDIGPDLLDDPKWKFPANEITCGGVTFWGVRIFLVSAGLPNPPQGITVDPVPPGPVGQRPVAESALAKWYKLRVQEWPKGAPPPSAEKDWLDTIEHFAPLLVTRVRLRAIRADHAPDAWKTKGRRKLAPK